MNNQNDQSQKQLSAPEGVEALKDESLENITGGVGSSRANSPVNSPPSSAQTQPKSKTYFLTNIPDNYPGKSSKDYPPTGMNPLAEKERPFTPEELQRLAQMKK